MDTTNGETILIVPGNETAALPTLSEWPRVIELAFGLIDEAAGMDEETETRQSVRSAR